MKKLRAARMLCEATGLRVEAVLATLGVGTAYVAAQNHRAARAHYESAAQRARELERPDLAAQADFETFYAQAPAMNPKRLLIKGVICGVRIEEIAEPTMREIRYLDKLVDELAKGRAMEVRMR